MTAKQIIERIVSPALIALVLALIVFFKVDTIARLNQFEANIEKQKALRVVNKKQFSKQLEDLTGVKVDYNKDLINLVKVNYSNKKDLFVVINDNNYQLDASFYKDINSSIVEFRQTDYNLYNNILNSRTSMKILLEHPVVSTLVMSEDNKYRLFLKELDNEIFAKD